MLIARLFEILGCLAQDGTACLVMHLKLGLPRDLLGSL